jgi:hypothetical protein
LRGHVRHPTDGLGTIRAQQERAYLTAMRAQQNGNVLNAVAEFNTDQRSSDLLQGHGPDAVDAEPGAGRASMIGRDEAQRLVLRVGGERGTSGRRKNSSRAAARRDKAVVGSSLIQRSAGGA